MGIIGFLASLVFVPGDAPILTPLSDCHNLHNHPLQVHRCPCISSRVHNCVSRKDHNLSSWHGIPSWNICVSKILRIVKFQPSWLTVSDDINECCNYHLKDTYLSVDTFCVAWAGSRGTRRMNAPRPQSSIFRAVSSLFSWVNSLHIIVAIVHSDRAQNTIQGFLTVKLNSFILIVSSEKH